MSFYPLVYRPHNQLVPHDFFKPWESVFKQLEKLTTDMNQLGLNNSSIYSNPEKFEVSVDVQHFTPDEISVKVINGYITVEGKHEERQDEHGFVSRQFVRRYPLPKGCLPDAVKSRLSSDGVLTVIAPKVLPLPSTGERIVPIIQTGPVKKHIGE